MIAPNIYSENAVKLLGFAESLRQSSLSNRLLRIEIAFLIKSNQWFYQLQIGIKRFADLLIAGTGLLAISPLLLTIAALIKITSPGPILYKSERIGKNYQPFPMFKFRTMSVDADAQREALREQAQLQGELFKIENDPRVTPIGKFLRAYSLDELPQLLNVMRGDMSLVGPRPLPADESAMFKDPFTLRFQVFPGITGIWQVSGRSNLKFEQLCQLEMSYVLKWNLWNDLKILFKTVPAVLCSRGAY